MRLMSSILTDCKLIMACACAGGQRVEMCVNLQSVNIEDINLIPATVGVRCKLRVPARAQGGRGLRCVYGTCGSEVQTQSI
jgi:hypothetical protein